MIPANDIDGLTCVALFVRSHIVTYLKVFNCCLGIFNRSRRMRVFRAQMALLLGVYVLNL